jgi:hypothetical protein
MSDMFSLKTYKQRMTDYYPNVVSMIKEFKAIIDAEYPEFHDINIAQSDTLDNAYLTTMGEGRIIQWEQVLGIDPLPDSTIDDRRDTIVARIRGQGKLNTAMINAIVNAFTGGTANSWIKDSVLYVEITPPPNNKQYRFENVEQELRKKVPAHLGINVSRNYFTWGEINDSFDSWNNVHETLDTWENVYLFSPFQV